MNKALPWNVNGVGFDARNAAREAARRQGKSLGEWLHGVIADHAADLGVDEHEMGGQQRINAVTSKLERLSARSSDHDRRLRAGRGNDYARRRTLRDREEDFAEREIRAARALRDPDTRRRPESGPAEATDFLLEEAIESMERRALRAERHADEALQSFTRLLERNEAARDRERQSVDVLAKKLSAIETRLTDRLAPPEEHPIKGALTRLEARLDSIGVNDLAPQAVGPTVVEQARPPAPVSPTASSTPQKIPEPAAAPRPREPYRRLEEKLNLILAAPPERAHADVPALTSPAAEVTPPARSAPASDPSHQRLEEKLNLILDAVSKRPAQMQQDAAALPAPAAGAPRDLGKAIADIVERQKTLDGDRLASPRSASRNNDATVGASTIQVDTARLAAMQSELSTLSSAVDGLRRDLNGQRKSRSQRAAELGLLVKETSDALRDITSRGNPAELAKSADVLFAGVGSARKQGLKGESLGAVKSIAGELRTALPRMNIAGLASELQIALEEVDAQIGRIAQTSADPAVISEAHDELRDVRDAVVAKSSIVDRLRRQIVFLTECLDRQVRHPAGDQDLVAEAEDLRTLLSKARDTASLGGLGQRLSAVSALLDQELAGSRQSKAGQEIAALQAAVRELGERMEAAQARGAGSDALEALHQQVALLSERLERSEEDLAKVGSIERSMGELFGHIEETRASVEAAAAEAARDVLGAAVEEGQFQADQVSVQSFAALRALQEESESRTLSTLGAVHGTLEKVVDRLSAMEADIAETRRRPQSRLPDAPNLETPSVRPLAEPRTHLQGGPDSSSTKPVVATDQRPPLRLSQDADAVTTPVPGGLLVRILGHRPGEDTSKAEVPVQSESRPADVKSDGEFGPADFIAAARRAAKIAQANLEETAKSKSPRKRRESLAAASRGYVARNKRPVLLAVAAVVVVAGTAQLIRLAADGGTQVAERTATTKVASAAEPVAASTKTASQSALPISAQPAQMASGTDPVQTGSVPSLPSFAAADAPTPRPLSAALKTMAESGSPAAEYALGVQLAEGSSQDFTHAAEWYQKAADHNIAPAQYRLASLYEKGLGVAQDKAKAKVLYLKAAEAGNPRAMHNLAVLLADGDGKPDYEGAANWFRKAAQFGIHDSQYNLAILLARGIGVKQSLVQSYQWFAVAAEQGDTDAAKKRDEVGARLGSGDIAVAKALASSFHPHAAELAAVDVQPPPGGWDGAAKTSPVNSARPKISSL